ncbi:protein of unknown function [Modestobacter italicus]|uniref:RHS repeat-associated core domain-containing protein n=1 Tax=Modestobacter italicus (strain DSM 44449 / CECT 9708 / BC 501) TaxID=2732864 RepID=I4F0W3_MODI5|nr:RHS repeat-associated core domain-containing protein [Modestobacter marinus]CCH89276.1 protein of unknown function [Modestobacter marinus]
MNGPDGLLGLPTTGDTRVPNGSGYYTHFQGGSIYWSPGTGPHIIGGEIRTKWGALGWETSTLGYPITDELSVPNGSGRYNHFTGGSIYWSPGTGAHAIGGSIRDRWAAIGWENSYLGYPKTDELTAPDGYGKYNQFSNGMIYWTGGTGAHDIAAGPIFNTWASLDYEKSWLGYPTSDPLRIGGGTRQEFQGGNLVLNDGTGTVTIGAGVLKNPTQFQRVTQARTQLKATAKVRPGGVSYDQVKFQWRNYDLTLDGGWADINPTQDLQTSTGGTVTPLTGTTTWLPVKDEDGGKASVDVYTWNATSTIPDDGLKQVRACLRVAGKAATDPDGTRCTGVTQITVDRAGLTGANATADAGPGTVGLLTGAYSVTGRDADVTAPSGGLAATRSFASNAPNRAGPFGSGWSLSLAVDEAGADYQSLIDRTDSVLITRGDGTQMPFLRKSSATPNDYVAEGEAGTEGWTLTFDPGAGTTAASYVLKDIDGDKVTFRRADAGPGHPTSTAAPTTPFRVEKVEALRGKTAAGTDQPPAVTKIEYTTPGNPKWLLAPTDAGTPCTAPAPTLAAGCRALEFVYTGTGAGERLDSIKLWATGAAATGTGLVTGDTPVQAQQITLASYTYNADGRLTQVTDPRTGQKVTYSYLIGGRLNTITPVGGTATWTLGYDNRVQPRLTSATLSDATGSGLPDQTTSVRYGLGLDGSTTGLPSFAAGEVARWGQAVVPTDLTAVFDPATIPDTTPTAVQWREATLYALDVNGRTVNTANYGGTADQDTGANQDPAWRITTTEYDPDGRGNVIRSLTAGNRDRALAAGADPDAEATQAKLLDSVNVYSGDGMDLLRAYGPARWVTVAAGDRMANARTRTTTTYDTPANHSDFPGQYLHIPVQTITDAVEIISALPTGSTGTEAGLPTLDGDGLRRITTLEYGTFNAWTFAIPTATRVSPGGGAAEVITRQTIDNQGRTTTSTLPSGGTSTTTAATTTTTYYSAVNNADPGCAKAEWAGWLCKTLPGGVPSAGAPVPTSHVTGYDVYGDPTRTVETGAGVTRTADISYDSASRVRRTTTTGNGIEPGQLRPTAETTYTAAGLSAQSRTINPDGSATGSTGAGTGAVARVYDAYSRLTSYTDSSGLVTTYTYDSVGRLSTVTNTHGSRIVSYDGDGERGSLPTSIDISGVGTFTARYGADGTLIRENLPGGLTATTIRDAGGDATSLTYRKTATDGTVSDWLRSTATLNGFDQVDTYRTVSATGTARASRYGYDGLGRLTTATDTTAVTSNGMPTGPSCTRSYGFDVNSNRTTLTQAANAGAPQGTCPATIPATDTYTYDTADRLQPAAARASLRYDAFGRTRTLPSTDTIGQGGDVMLDYYVDDLVASMSQSDRSTTITLDATARRSVRTDTDNATPGVSRTEVSYYTGDDDNPDVVKEASNEYTRNIISFGGLAATVTRSGTAGATVMLQLANLHGDIAATVPKDSVAPADMTLVENTEYGVPRTAPAANTTMARYGWLGSHQRDASTPGGLTLMGVRLYSAPLGRFLTVDPVAGGSANDYEYANGDPTNQFDLDGRMPGWLRKAANVVGGAASVASFIPGPLGMAAAGVAAGAYAATGQWGKAAGAAVGLLPGGQLVGRLARATKFSRSLGTLSARLPGIGAKSKLFRPGGILNSNRGGALRMGWSKGTKHFYNFRIGTKGSHRGVELARTNTKFGTHRF